MRLRDCLPVLLGQFFDQEWLAAAARQAVVFVGGDEHSLLAAVQVMTIGSRCAMVW